MGISAAALCQTLLLCQCHNLIKLTVFDIEEQQRPTTERAIVNLLCRLAPVQPTPFQYCHY